MSETTDARLRLVCILLTGVTLLSWWLGGSGGSYSLNAGITASVLLIAAIKVRVIVWEFMELRHAPSGMRHAADGLLAVLMCLLLGIYLLGT